MCIQIINDMSIQLGLMITQVASAKKGYQSKS